MKTTAMGRALIKNRMERMYALDQSLKEIAKELEAMEVPVSDFQHRSLQLPTLIRRFRDNRKMYTELQQEIEEIRLIEDFL